MIRYEFGGQMFSLTHSFARLQRNLCKKSGLYSGQPRVLTILQQEEGCTLKELSALCDIGMPSLSVSVRNMEKSGLLRREGAVRNQRLYLTDLGRQRARIFHEEIDSFYVGLLDHLGEQDAQQLSDLMRRMTAYIDQFNNDYEENQ